MAAPRFATHQHRHSPDVVVEVVEETATRVVYRTVKVYARTRESFELDYQPIPVSEADR